MKDDLKDDFKTTSIERLPQRKTTWLEDRQENSYIWRNNLVGSPFTHRTGIYMQKGHAYRIGFGICEWLSLFSMGYLKWGIYIYAPSKDHTYKPNCFIRYETPGSKSLANFDSDFANRHKSDKIQRKCLDWAA